MSGVRAASSGVPAPLIEQVLYSAIGLNFQLTTDQSLVKRHGGSRYIVTRVIAICRSGGATVACAGGIYNSAAKAGNAIVAAAQSWITLSAANKVVQAALSTGLTDSETATPILSLTTGSTAAATADVYVLGFTV